MEGKVK
ncbi:Protein of unknown function [Bacillus mycoides]|nr:Protein of unknown function [Bacillus mycoides]